jgi:hypothetical protein
MATKQHRTALRCTPWQQHQRPPALALKRHAQQK